MISQEQATELLIEFNAMIEQEHQSLTDDFSRAGYALENVRMHAINNARIQFVQYIAAIANGTTP